MAVTTSPAQRLPLGNAPRSEPRPGAATLGRELGKLQVVEGFEHWYETHFDYVWRSLRRLGVPLSDIGDLTHDVFVVAWQRRGSLDPERPLRAWLFGVAFRVASAHRRRSWFSRTDLEPEPQIADPGLTPEQATLIRAELAQLQAAIAKVPLRHRAVLLLHDFDEVPVADVAVALEVPLKTAYSRLAAGRKYFRRALRQAELEALAFPYGAEP